MKVFLSLASGIIIFSALSLEANAKDHGHGKGRGHDKHYYKKQKHYCGGHCHHDAPRVHHYYREEKVVIIQPRPRPSINISVPL